MQWHLKKQFYEILYGKSVTRSVPDVGQTFHSDQRCGTSGTVCAGICDCAPILVHFVFICFFYFCFAVAQIVPLSNILKLSFPVNI